ncbi:bifunctional aspartate kinase/homoserine dehydrogenase II [Enterovibrio sp. ZSDZ35]|uniref:Bifunctional aspartokinase/homoserine dehydrogenase n=1 Tax=Enterovibrio qingdaonensis TaxID=2899818 RepID=A0ABT5QMJ8_9GAMM|nr:bifunctional aspartate kinase/homoserine dehydrogenase II [Enterovibrio sp. ZSDZ35]MDD1782104.1 bifunctional aspartate kinase/homoserine dehydrogenase II [Enterovibrio sp. ZSDZ35]
MSAVEVVSPQQLHSRQLHKFGGSSLADPDCFRRVAKILEQYSGATDIIVVSAAGKTTNRLIEWLSLLSQDGRLAHESFQNLRKYQQDLIENLIEGDQKQDLVDLLYNDFSEMAKVSESPLSEAQRAWVQGFGEIWSARLLSSLLTQLNLPAVKLDSRSFLRAERGAQPEVDRASSWPLLKEQLIQHTQRRVVITGFMAQNKTGETVLLGRNGSDYSATIIGALADVSRVTIWSDVAGVYSADPRVVIDSCLLPLLRLDEAAELARLAAPVLHTRTLQPVAQSNIDLNLRCSYDPESGSTRIERVLASGRGAKIITSLNDVCVLQLDIPRSHDFAAAQRDVESLLSKKQIQPLAASSSADQHRIQLAYTAEVVNSVLEQIQDAGIPADIRLREGFSMVAAVGAGVTANPVHCHGFYQQLRGQPMEFICESSNGLSIAALLRKANTSSLVADIHRQLFQAQRRIGLVLLGKGNIGSRWLSLFNEQKAALEKRHGMNFELISVQDSDAQWVDFSGIDSSVVMEKFAEKATAYKESEWIGRLLNHPFDDIVVLDVTASTPLAAQYTELAEHGFHLISANKVAGSASAELYHQVQDAFSKTGRYWLYNATVGAGLPINHTVRDLRESGDQIMALSGIFSGTLSWLFQQFNGEVKFSELLEQAWQQGLTEPDPREDLSGADVMRKLVILARESGLILEPEQVQVQSLVPEELSTLSLDGFLDQSKKLDEVLEDWLERAKKEQGVLRYVARLTREGKARVGIEVLQEEHPLANLLPCDNIFAIESQWYRENPLVIRGPGAGRDVTAGALLSDLNRIASLLK